MAYETEPAVELTGVTVRYRVAAEHPGASGPAAPVKVRNQAVQRTQKCRLARTRRTDHQDELAGLDRDGKIGERGHFLIGVGVCNAFKLDQDSTVSAQQMLFSEASVA